MSQLAANLLSASGFSPQMWPQLFTTLGTSPATTNLGSAQGVTVRGHGDTLWTAGGDGFQGGGRTVVAYDENYDSLGSITLSPYLADYSQVNGVSYDNGKIYCGANNYATEPMLGRILVLDADTLELLESQFVGADWSEGGAIRPGTQEFWACYHNLNAFRRYDVTVDPWTLEATYATDGFATNTPDTYQALSWFSSTILLAPIHGVQTSPPTIDVFRYDPNTDVLTPVYRMARPGVNAHQGFGFTDNRTLAFFSERHGGGPNINRVLEASVTSVLLRDETVNVSSGQRSGLTHWYPAMGGVDMELPDNIGTDDGIPTSSAWVYPTLDSDGWRWVNFRGTNAGSRIEFGNLFPDALTEFTISFWYHHQDTTADLHIINGDAAGTNVGDWSIQSNVGSAGRINMTCTAVGATTSRTLTTPIGDALSVDDKVLITITQDGDGMTIYLDGVESASNALTAQISGNDQDVYAGALDTGSGYPFAIRDLRIADVAMTSTQVEAMFDTDTRYDMWQPTE